MKKSLLYSFLLVFLIFGSCKKEEQTDPVIDYITSVTVVTELYSDGAPIEIGDTMTFEDGTIFNLKLFKLYLSNLTLVNSNGEYPMKDITLLDVGDSTTGSFSAEFKGKLNFTSLKMGFGVDAVQNNSDPTTFPDEHPLSSYNQMYWTMLKYRFAILEGRSNANGAFDMSSDVLNAYHPGTDPVYQTRTFDFDAPTFSHSIRLILKIDVEDLFYNSPAINLATEASTHSEASDIHIAQKFMSNLAKSTTLEVDQAVSL